MWENAKKNTGRTIRSSTQTTVLFSWYGSYKKTVSYNYFYIYCLITIQRKIYSLQVFVFVMQAKSFGSLLTLFLVGVHLNWQFPAVTARVPKRACTRDHLSIPSSLSRKKLPACPMVNKLLTCLWGRSCQSDCPHNVSTKSYGVRYLLLILYGKR
jgi:hypothetical protein